MMIFKNFQRIFIFLLYLYKLEFPAPKKNYSQVWLQFVQWFWRRFNRQLSASLMVVTTIYFAHTIFLWATCCLICFISIVKPLLTHWSWLRFVSFIWYGNRAHGGVTSGQEMLTPPRHLIPLLIYSEVRVCSFSDLYFLLDLWDWLLFVIYAISWLHPISGFCFEEDPSLNLKKTTWIPII
jgi:hypothetical protein